MNDRRIGQISSRKQPRQARSVDLVAAVLTAAVQVLRQEGAGRFTTARVAERAGVSVGSLYQYFPNKAAILFRLQSDEWRQTTALLCGILEQEGAPPSERLRALVHAFIRSECDEADIRIALNDAAPLYRDAPEAHEARTSGDHAMEAFMRVALPKATDATRAAAGELVATTLSAVGQRFSAQPRDAEEIERFADAMADMFCAYLGALAAHPERHPGSTARTREDEGGRDPVTNPVAASARAGRS